MAMKRTDINTDDIIRRYASSESIKAIAKSVNVSRHVIYRVLRENHITPRNRSEAMYVRMANTPPPERQRLVEKAHKARRGMKETHDVLIRKAKTREKTLQFVGKGERFMLDGLISRGLDAKLQRAVDRFNIDVSVGNIAVEILCAYYKNPFTRVGDAKKVKYLCEAGWLVIYVMVGKIGDITEGHIDYVASLINRFSDDPSLSGQYRVIGRDLYEYSRGGADSDYIPSI